MVRIFIETRIKGKFADCRGAYSIVLETEIDGTVYTKTHFGAWEHATPQRIQLRAVIDALRYMKTPSLIEIYIKSPYVAAAYRHPDTAKSNRELWQEYEEMAKEHDIEIINESHNEYSPAMITQLRNMKHEYLEDRRNCNGKEERANSEQSR